ncbi:MAG: prolyl oligopeptidase family serine peptidase [Proteobacteria bacterium]|nr:prolyl oligopeptidase family serine peptidase [Pseudomonadota bacterium]
MRSLLRPAAALLSLLSSPLSAAPSPTPELIQALRVCGVTRQAFEALPPAEQETVAAKLPECPTASAAPARREIRRTPAQPDLAPEAALPPMKEDPAAGFDGARRRGVPAPAADVRDAAAEARAFRSRYRKLERERDRALAAEGWRAGDDNWATNQLALSRVERRHPLPPAPDERIFYPGRASRNPAGPPRMPVTDVREAPPGPSVTGAGSPVPHAGVPVPSVPAHPAPPLRDSYLWLEQGSSARVRDWSRERSAKAEAELAADAKHAPLLAEAQALHHDASRLPSPTILGERVYNFWQDKEHPRGVWRRTSLSSYESAAPKWETVLDVDRLAADEREEWTWKGSQCLPREYRRCLLYISRRGKDAAVIREFDVESKTFVEGGFSLPEARSWMNWRDIDSVWVGTDFGPGTRTDAGNPRVVKLWKRGTPLAQAATIYDAPAEAKTVFAWTVQQPDRNISVVQTVTRGEESLHLIGGDGKLTPVPVVADAQLVGHFRDQAIFKTYADWTPRGVSVPKGSLVAIPIERIADADPRPHATVLYRKEPLSTASYQGASKSRLYVHVLDKVQSRLMELTPAEGGWDGRRVPLPEGGRAAVVASDAMHDRVIIAHEGFVAPPTLYELGAGGESGSLRPIKKEPARFDAKGLVVDQRWAASKDGTKVPYFLVHRAGMKLDGSHPTLLEGYGGFGVSKLPSYRTAEGKLWLEKGGAFALANIRGGGELGTEWYWAATREKRQRAYDDFIAVAEHLIETKVTSPRRLGIFGASNGGLLVGVAMTQRPELFNAVVCAVPLLDMMRYSKLPFGPQWVGEYGDPDDPKHAAALKAYSPYHNLKPGARYPKVLFLASKEDDRVSPAHARKMAAKMEAMGHSVLYFENATGGHDLSDNPDDDARVSAAKFTFLHRQLFP